MPEETIEDRKKWLKWAFKELFKDCLDVEQAQRKSGFNPQQFEAIYKKVFSPTLIKLTGLVSEFQKKSPELYKNFEPLVAMVEPKQHFHANFVLSVVKASDLVDEVFQGKEIENMIQGKKTSLTQTRKKLDELVKLVKFNMNVAGKWAKWQQKKAGFQLKPIFMAHLESPFAVGVYHKNKLVATVGGFIDHRANQKTLVINNIQGRTADHLEISPEKAKELYRQLSQAFDGHWRSSLVKNLAEKAQKLRLRVEGEPPSGGEGSETKKEYRRQFRQYDQTFRKAGLSRTPRKTLEYVSFEEKKRKWVKPLTGKKPRALRLRKRLK